MIGLRENRTAELAQPRKHSNVTRPFSSREGGVWVRDYWEGETDAKYYYRVHGAGGRTWARGGKSQGHPPVYFETYCLLVRMIIHATALLSVGCSGVEHYSDTSTMATLPTHLSGSFVCNGEGGCTNRALGSSVMVVCH